MSETECTVMRGREIARPIREDVANRATALREQGWVPRLASLEIGQNPAAAVYIRNQAKLANKLGIDFENRQYSHDITQAEMLAAIHSLNVDPRVTGIIIQRPVPQHLDLFQLQGAVATSKDVEGMNPANIGKVLYDEFILGPCTSLASVEVLKATGLPLRGMNAVVVGHSEIVGKPIALHLLAELVTVTICHHGTRHLAAHTCHADALFVAVGKPGLITAEMVKPGAAVIDIGINQIEVKGEDGETRTRIVGDVDYPAVKQVAGFITPVPGGVGPVTVSILMRNTVAAVEIQKRAYEQAMLV